ELRGIKNYLSGVFVLQNSSRGSIINQLRQIELHELPADHLATLVPRINAVTPAEVSEMARKYLPIDDMTLIVVGDPDTVTPDRNCAGSRTTSRACSCCRTRAVAASSTSCGRSSCTNFPRTISPRSSHASTR